MRGPSEWGTKLILVTGTGTITLADHFPGTTFASTDQYSCWIEQGQGRITARSTTTISINNDTSPSGDTYVAIAPLKSAN